MLRLFGYWRSSATYRVRIGLNLKGLPYDTVPIDLKPGTDEQHGAAYRAVNPQGRVPALGTEHGVLTQSLAILDWLDETYPAPPFLPRNAWIRAQIRAFALTIACDIHPLNNVAVLARLKAQWQAGEMDVQSWYAHWIVQGFAALEAQIAQRPPTPFLFGGEPSLADICLVPQMANARRFDVDLTPFARLVAADQQARAHPAFAKAAPDVSRP